MPKRVTGSWVECPSGKRKRLPPPIPKKSKDKNIFDVDYNEEIDENT